MNGEPDPLPDRAIDKVLDPQFVNNLRELSDDQLRERQELATEVERELSAARRSLHRIVDLLDRERRGREAEA